MNDAEQKPERLGTLTNTPHGFAKLGFHDSYGNECSLQASSAIGDYEDAMQRPGTSMLWLGLTNVRAEVMAREARQVGVATDETVGWVDFPIPDQVLVYTRMHLNREQVAGLRDRLTEWLEMGTW